MGRFIHPEDSRRGSAGNKCGVEARATFKPIIYVVVCRIRPKSTEKETYIRELRPDSPLISRIPCSYQPHTRHLRLLQRCRPRTHPPLLQHLFHSTQSCRVTFSTGLSYFNIINTTGSLATGGRGKFHERWERSCSAGVRRS